jgi:hypothetical protein
MFLIGEEKLKGIVDNAVRVHLSGLLRDFVLELDPNKYYLLILPEDISPEDSAKALQPFANKFNLAVLHANTAKLLELK